jgi:cycloeucalenol cycloisomerase
MEDSSTDIAVTMTAIMATMLAGLAALVSLQTRLPDADKVSSFLPSVDTQPSKRAYELFVACYTPVWIFCFAIIIAFQLYEQFTAVTYLQVCGGLALPFWLQPLVFPTAGFQSPDAKRPFSERYALKANIWLAVYSFIGNYWYTHYFYSVLKAAYTMPSHRLNNVPIAMFLATHFYFSTYHFFSNALLRKVVTTFVPGFRRKVLYGSVILAFSYFTAFMETLTISSYPYYTFEDRNMAYTIGSAFYGIYFLVSFPAFFHFDNDIDNSNNNSSNNKNANHRPVTLWETFVSSCGYGMIILTLLDFVRLYLDVPLVVGSSNLTCTSN